jgi:hypothetical protein
MTVEIDGERIGRLSAGHPLTQERVRSASKIDA